MKKEEIDLFIFAGEHSSDTHGFYLLKALKTLHPSLKICGVGGPKMRSFGDVFFLPMEPFLIAKPWDFVFKRYYLWKQFRKLVAKIMCLSVKTVVIIDYPGALAMFAKKLREKGFQGKIVQYICPSLFFWKAYVKQLAAETLDALLTIFPFENQMLERIPIPVQYVGNPMLEDLTGNGIKQQKEKIPNHARILGIFPGSRIGVVKRNFPSQLKAALALKKENPNLEIVISAFNERCNQIINPLVKDVLNISVVMGKSSYDIMQKCYIAFASCGTTALELALNHVPSVVTYNYSLFEKTFEGLYIKWPFPYRCLVNVLMNRSVFPEFIYDTCKWGKIYSAAKELYSSTTLYQERQQDCRKICELLDIQSSPSENVANFLMQTL